jgi:hypothetical protein
MNDSAIIEKRKVPWGHFSRKSEQSESILTEAFLFERLGAAPSVSQVAGFLNESPTTTWRRLKDGQFKALDGPGTTRINLKSLVVFLNSARDYEVTHKRGKLPDKTNTKQEVPA